MPKARLLQGSSAVRPALTAASPSQLYRASALFETIRHEVQLSTDYKLSLFDLQTSSYQALQRVLVSLGERQPSCGEGGRASALLCPALA